MQKKIFIIAGPTASGKSAAAIKLSKECPSVIINADSMQVYSEVPVLSAQPSHDDKAAAKHIMYGFISAKDEFSAGRWLELAKAEIDKALAENIRPIIVGGTGLYFKSLVEGMAKIPDISPEVREKTRAMFDEMGKEKFHLYLQELDKAGAEKIRPSDKQRMLRAAEVKLETGRSLQDWQKDTKAFYPRDTFEIILMLPDRAELYRNCDARFAKMLEAGALDEAKKLKEMNLPATSTASKVLGARELISYLNGESSLNEAMEYAQQMTRNYAKRQYTWFRNQAL